tara:strand:- start:19116 stop:21197 length:2082 start_codon:yes stop_codon:yes gene_type:complete
MNNKNTLLIEIGTEELPPNGLNKLAHHFLSEITKRFQAQKIPMGATEAFVSPRRIAVRLADVPLQQPDFTAQKRGPQLKSAFKDGQPTKAALGFAKSCQVDVSALTKLETEQGAWLVFEQEISGQPLNRLLPQIITESLNALPLPKKMRWGNSELAFIRPIHWITIVHGERGIECDILGFKSENYTYGHRYHFPDKVKVNHADNYLNVLRDVKVLADHAERKDIIVRTAKELAHKVKGEVIIEEPLLDTVAGLVEWPVPLVASFHEDLLKVPKEALISSMQGHQKCFPIVDAQNQLLSKFILVSNIEAADNQHIILGNEKVMHARLEDAKFFYAQDSQNSLASHVAALKDMTYQKALGSLYEKCQRVTELSVDIATELHANPKWAQRAGELCKADLTTNMVFEFPELQGIMGYYYALKDNEPEEVALALKEIYLPAHAKDSLPQTGTGICLALSERLDTLVGIFGIGLIPTGEKDPYALRRAAIGLLRIIIDKKLDLDLKSLIEKTHEKLSQSITNPDTAEHVLKFCLDRYKAWYQEQGIAPQVIEAVFNTYPTRPLDMSQRTLAVNHFLSLEAAQSLASANKRVRNILEKNKIDFNLQKLPEINRSLLQESAEKSLFNEIDQLKNETMPLIQAGEYQKALVALSQLKQPIDLFFDNVLVMSKDSDLKQNRIHLLTHLYALFMQIADISKLAL